MYVYVFSYCEPKLSSVYTYIYTQIYVFHCWYGQLWQYYTHITAQMGRLVYGLLYCAAKLHLSVYTHNALNLHFV